MEIFYLINDGIWDNRRVPALLETTEDVIPIITKKNAKLSKAQALEIRELYIEGHATQRELAKKYKVSQSVISETVNFKTWKLY